MLIALCVASTLSYDVDADLLALPEVQAAALRLTHVVNIKR